MSKTKKKRDKKYVPKEFVSSPGTNFLKSLGKFSHQKKQRNTRAAAIHIPRKPK